MDIKQLSIEIRSAIKKGNTEKVVELIRSNEEILNMMTVFGTWLHVAATRGELDIVKKLIELGSDINKVGGISGGGALNEAATGGHIDTVRYLLSCGADMDVSEPERNPLFGAIINGHVDIAKLLIESGIDTYIKYTGENMKNMDALAFAREHGQEKIVKMLENKKNMDNMYEKTDNHQEHHNTILEYVEKYFGDVKTTITETIPGSIVTININIIHPSMDKDFITLVTTGMSDEVMDYSYEDVVPKYAELLLKLPSDWKIDKDNMEVLSSFWPLGWLRKVAHIPHIYDGWIDEGVIIPNGEPPQYYGNNTKLSCMMVCRPKEYGLDVIDTKKGKINIYTLIPIYKEERDLALEKGHEYLLKKMSEKGITDVLDIDRVNVGI